ncbi:hypothetical protein MKD41_07255 [Lutibacter sp. A64]|uniref:hypothetical protein n=1 Tax=Lutibacter sp. A64 TaxID=2918526 RepID=UPI001F055B3A|nr:hypothetical protein [Lutibacter sp. A64]UMB55262.1 hypothetical protein MKD41_07255 [Lutibacter sp. A64]
MIRYLKNNELNLSKYNTCIKASVNSRIYAFSWYLDCVADNWDALVLNDYEAVMPLPWRQKYFIKYIYPPAWTQQLGVFSPNPISEKLVLDFIKAIPKKFKKITIQFNSENKFQHKNVTERINYVLPLNKPYEDIYKGFNSNRKRDLKRVFKENYNINFNIAPKEFLDFYLSVSHNYKINKTQIETLKRLLNSKNKIIHLVGVYVKNILEGSILFLIDKNRITNLVPITSDLGKEKRLTTLILNEIIYKYENTDRVLDFEGSMVKGVASFYKSFGAEKESYTAFFYKNVI